MSAARGDIKQMLLTCTLVYTLQLLLHNNDIIMTSMALIAMYSAVKGLL